MNRTYLALALVALSFVSCKKDEVTPPLVVVTEPLWDLWVVPRNDGSITLTVNGDTIPILHDSNYPYPSYLPAAYRPPAEVYYPVPVQVRRGDIVTLSTEGVHELLIGPHRVAVVDTGRIILTVYL